jgi:hypothetical protein
MGRKFQIVAGHGSVEWCDGLRNHGGDERYGRDGEMLNQGRVGRNGGSRKLQNHGKSGNNGKEWKM